MFQGPKKESGATIRGNIVKMFLKGRGRTLGCMGWCYGMCCLYLLFCIWVTLHGSYSIIVGTIMFHLRRRTQDMPKKKKKKGQRMDDMDDGQLPFLVELNPGNNKKLLLWNPDNLHKNT